MRFDNSRFYSTDGTAVYEIPKKRGNGMKAPNITDAKELGLVPSVTTVQKVLNRPELNQWIAKQWALAILTAPRKHGEKDDEFVERVLVTEAQQDEEAIRAADTGTKVHNAIALALTGLEYPGQYEPYVKCVLKLIDSLGKLVWAERVLVGDGYAGRADALVDAGETLILPDFKTTKKLPEKGSWPEHKMQTAAYAKALGNTGDKRVITANLYLSTTIPGTWSFFTQDDWLETYERGFVPCLKMWQWLNHWETKP